MPSTVRVFLVTLVAGPVIIVGFALCLTIVGTIVGIPILTLGGKMLGKAMAYDE